MKTPVYAWIRYVRCTAILFTALLIVTGCVTAKTQSIPNAVTRVPMTFFGGHATEDVDHGRPVILIAAALGVPPDVFRDAFRHVHPVGLGRGGPTDVEARQNKAALLHVLGPYGVTDERLNAVSDFYRYSLAGGLWATTPAVANALVKDGVVIGYEIIGGGAGYTTPPVVSVPGFTGVAAPKVDITFSKDVERNGTVAAILMPQKTGK